MSVHLVTITLFSLNAIAGALDVPRVTSAELDASPLLLSGKVPFILTDGMEDWPSRKKFAKLDFFSENFPDAIVDYYPNNLAQVSKKPFLRKFADVLDEFSEENPVPEGGWLRNGRSEQARYIHWRMTAAQWNKVDDLLTPMHPFFTTDQPWMKQCIPKKIRNPKNPRQVNWPMNNWIKHTHWKIIVVGEHDSGMFFHADGFSTSTFVFQFVGRKRWTLCVPDPHMKHMSNAGVIDTFGSEEHLDQFPRYKDADCSQFDVHPGEVIYYPSHYWHQTLNLDRPCTLFFCLMFWHVLKQCHALDTFFVSFFLSHFRPFFVTFFVTFDTFLFLLSYDSIPFHSIPFDNNRHFYGRKKSRRKQRSRGLWRAQAEMQTSWSRYYEAVAGSSTQFK